jgi:transcription initiation factor IIE alpha subunit
LSPQDELDRKERIVRCYEILQEIASGNEDMEMVRMCVKEGIIKAREIADTTGIAVNEIYKILRHFRDKGKQYTKDFL